MVLQTWDCFTLLHNSANHLIYCGRVTNDSFWMKIVLTNKVPSILFCDTSFQKGFFSPSERELCAFPKHSIADGFDAASFPRVARSHCLMLFYKVFAQGPLTRGYSDLSPFRELTVVGFQTIPTFIREYIYILLTIKVQDELPLGSGV